MTERLIEVRVEALPSWLDAERLLGPDAFVLADAEDGTRTATGSMRVPDAAALVARLRGLGFDGVPLRVSTKPKLSRERVREGRLAEARARRSTTKGFERPGTHLDDEGRFSLTPERIALALGQRAKAEHVLDVFCGAGGSAIGFARAGARVTAFEIDPGRADDARHNVRRYGLASAVRITTGDAARFLPEAKADLVFLDPPWGGTYDKQAVQLEDLPELARVLPLCAHAPRVWLKLPPSFVTRALPDFVPEAVFGEAEGDARRVKFLLLRRESEDEGALSSGGATSAPRPSPRR